jgi:hypothetical protein
VAAAHVQLAHVALADRRPRDALTHGEAALALLADRALGSPLAVADALAARADALAALGDRDGARRAALGAWVLRLGVPGLDPAVVRASAARVQALAPPPR